MNKCPIVAATTANCVEYQSDARAAAIDAAYYLSVGAFKAAAHAQERSRIYSDAAWDRLARLIGVE